MAYTHEQVSDDVKEKLIESLRMRLEKLLMCDVTQRYALLYRLGFSHGRVRMMEVRGIPAAVANRIIEAKAADSRISVEEAILHLGSEIMRAPLPKGIPERK